MVKDNGLKQKQMFNESTRLWFSSQNDFLHEMVARRQGKN
jgi:hypothetical protein